MLTDRTLLLLCALCTAVRSYRILGIFPVAAPSHYILGNALMKGLAEAGHDVTIISPFEEKQPPKNGSYRDVVLTGFQEEFKNIFRILDPFDDENENVNSILTIKTFMSLIFKQNEDVFRHENVKKLLNSKQKFDLVIVEQFLLESMKIFGHIYNVPVIAFSTIAATPWINKMVGNPSPLSYIPGIGTEFSTCMTFTQRLMNVFSYLFLQLIEELYYFPEHNALLKRHFSNPPDIYDLYYNVSLLLLNSHESLNSPVPYVPKMIQIGGFHVKPPQKLPKDLQEYLDNATEGVVYFSLGSNLKSKNLPPVKRDAFLTAFGKLKEKVLWKWEEEDMIGKPSNVKLAKWLPQQDILAHPNVKLFITHGGQLSITEAVYHGMPMLVIPVFGDQYINSKLATHNGYALSLPYNDPLFSEEKLSGLLHELLTSSEYRGQAKKISHLFHDRPMKPMDTAVYWVEYVIRNQGALHLKVAGVPLPWYIYHSVDVIIFVIIIAFLVTYMLYLTVKKILYSRRNSGTQKSKSKPE